VRLHSTCLTGDCSVHGAATAGNSFGSLWRCSKTWAAGSFYLTREGRGLGLANKMRTYQLQDEGLDTFDAPNAEQQADRAAHQQSG
jgi:GTP cyclohydrolase II